MNPKIKKSTAPAGNMKIFVRGLNWVGDAIIATPTLAHLRQSYPDAHITLMVRPWVAAVYEHNPDINELWVHDDSASTAAFLKAIRMVRKGRFTLGLALPNSWRSGALLYFGGVRHRVGYRRGGRGWMLNRAVELKPEILEVHQVYYYLHLLETLCGKPAQAPTLKLCAGDLEREEVGRLLDQLGIDQSRPLVGIAPGSINSNAKRWPAERFAAVADRLAGPAGAEVLLLGSGKEKDVLDRVATQCQAKVHNIGGQLTLAQVVALIERLSGMICNDSGAMHIAAALRIPTVAIFGPTEFNTTYPFSNVATIVRKDVDCAPCMLRECPIDHRCMTMLGVEDVMEGFRKVVHDARELQKQNKR